MAPVFASVKSRTINPLNLIHAVGNKLRGPLVKRAQQFPDPVWCARSQPSQAAGRGRLALKQHVMLIINRAGQGGNVCSAASGASAGSPSKALVAAKLDAQLVTAQPKPGQLPDLLV